MNFKTLFLILGLGCIAATGVVIVYIRRDSELSKNGEKDKKAAK